MRDDLISVIDLANKHGAMKQTVFKVLKRLGVETTKLRGSNSRGQTIAYVTHEDAKRVEQYFDGKEVMADKNSQHLQRNEYETGVFYLAQLEPEIAPGRFKVGFAVSLNERMRHHRCSAPFATTLGSWPCKRLWERTAIEFVTKNCKQIHTEVFESSDINQVLTRCDKFFGLMSA